MPQRQSERRIPLVNICSHCGFANIAERRICKHCRQPLGAPQPAPRIAAHGGTRETYQVELPAVPRWILLLLGVSIIAPFAGYLLVVQEYFFLVLVVSLSLVWFIKKRPDRPQIIRLTLSDRLIEFEEPDLHICTTWSNVAELFDGVAIILHKPAAIRLEYRRGDAYDSTRQRERTISLDGFDLDERQVICKSVHRYAPHIQMSMSHVEPDGAESTSAET